MQTAEEQAKIDAKLYGIGYVVDGERVHPSYVLMYKSGEPVKEYQEEGASWRRLALQFDGHRMQAIWHLKAMLQDPEAHRKIAEDFLAAGPLSGEEVLAERIKEIAARKVKEEGISDSPYRQEFLDKALECGAVLTGKPDASEPITVVFHVDAWRKFDRAQSRNGVSPELDVDKLAQFIRSVDVNRRLGAGALAEQIYDWITDYQSTPVGDALPPCDGLLAHRDGTITMMRAFLASSMESWGNARYQQGRAAGIEEAAKVCDQQASEPECPERAQYCADAIRALNK